MTILPDNQTSRELASRAISNGGVIAFCTDTFYGLGADPLNRQAIQRIMKLKGREEKPILLLISDLEQVDHFISSQSEVFQRLTKSFWPGPLTIVAPAHPHLAPELTARSGKIGLRLPADDSLRGLIRICGGALTATSANLSGASAACSASEVANYFPEGLDVILDSGQSEATVASTVLDVSQPTPRLVREGVVSRARLEEVLGRVS